MGDGEKQSLRAARVQSGHTPTKMAIKDEQSDGSILHVEVINDGHDAAMIESGNCSVHPKVSKVIARYLFSQHSGTCMKATDSGFRSKILMRRMMSSRDQCGSQHLNVSDAPASRVALTLE